MPKKVKRSPRLSCKEKLSEKIRINMREYKEGRWVSPQQAIAVAYSQVLKKSPSCKKALASKRRSAKSATKSSRVKKSTRKKSPVKRRVTKSRSKKN
jgi:hypothetical protein